MPTQRSRHTPWSYKWQDGAATVIETDTGRTVAYIYPTPASNGEHETAQQIAREHNSHAALLEALQNLTDDVEYALPSIEPGLIGLRQVRAARAAIAAATEE